MGLLDCDPLLLSLLLSLLVASSLAYDATALRKELLSQGYEETKTLTNYRLDNGQQVVYVDFEGAAFDQEVWDDLLQQGRKALKSNLNDTGSFLFLPVTIGAVHDGGAQLSWSSRCFEKVTASLKINAENCTVSVQATGHRELACAELYWWATRESINLEVLDHAGRFEYVLVWHEYERSDVSQFGVRVFLEPYDLETLAASLALTYDLFRHSTEQLALDFYAEHIQWAAQPRSTGFFNLTDELISGDYFGMNGLGGLATLITWGTGSYTSHTAVALRFPDGMYVCESDASGVHRTPAAEWISNHASEAISMMRLRPEYQQKFNEQAAIDWFKTVDGMPYGYHNFMFTFLDTPNSNLPRPFTQSLFEVAMGGWERIIPFNESGSLYSMLIMGLNHRLNTNCTELECIYRVLDPKGWTLSQACAIPEQDSWTYDGDYSMVCDSFVIAMYKKAGVFGNLADLIQATEQTPKDTYQMALFDAQWQRPKQCVEDDPALPYCQFAGNFRLTMPGFNSIEPYAHMNEACASLSPVFYRPNGC